MRTTTILQKQAQARKGQNADRYCLARYIDGISLNGFEYLLDRDGEILWFDSDYDAYKFCFDNMTGLLLPNLEEEKYQDQDFTFLYHKLEEHGIYITHESEVQDG